MKIRYKEIIERMKKAGSFKNDSVVARFLGVTPQALSNYKKREAMPYNLIFRFADKTGISLDWLVYGGDDMDRKNVKKIREVVSPVKNIGTPGHFPSVEF